MALTAWTRLMNRLVPTVGWTSLCPGWCNTSMSSGKGPRSAAEGAKTASYLALSEDPDVCVRPRARARARSSVLISLWTPTHPATLPLPLLFSPLADAGAGACWCGDDAVVIFVVAAAAAVVVATAVVLSRRLVVGTRAAGSSARRSRSRGSSEAIE